MTTSTTICRKAMFVLAIIMFYGLAMHAQIVYVKSTATGLANGTSWTNAYTDLQVAIDHTPTADTIFVAGGTYFPSFRLAGDSLRNSTFFFNRDMTVYGGFSGEPGTEGAIDSRDPDLNQTILSGDFGIPGDPADNAFHVVYLDRVSDTFRLDGFIIEKGSGLNGAGFESLGSGVFINAENGRCHPVLVDCLIRDMIAQENAGGIQIYASNGKSNPTLIGCSIVNCEGSGGGGVSINADLDGESKPVMINCRFVGNTARTAQGSAVSIVGHSVTVSPRFVNCIFTGNHTPTSQTVSIFLTGTGISQSEFINCTFSGNSGGIIRLSNIGTDMTSVVFARNCIFWGNAGNGISVSGGNTDIAHSVADFFGVGEFMINLNPHFVLQPAVPTDHAHTDGDVHVQDDSPAIDVGLNAAVPVGIIEDLDGQPRFINPFNGLAGQVDCGPFEVQASTSAVAPTLPDSDWSVYPNPANDRMYIHLNQTTTSALVQVIDLHGKSIFSHISSGSGDISLDVSALPSGIYGMQMLVDGKMGVKLVVVD